MLCGIFFSIKFFNTIHSISMCLEDIADTEYKLLVGILTHMHHESSLVHGLHTFGVPFSQIPSIEVREKRKLVQPHMVLCILAGYTSNTHTRDVWQLLQTNWNHFFWLTGETPDTLRNMITKIERRFNPNVERGCKSLLDMRNQVCNLT